MAQWYCYIGGQRYGPVSEEQLRQWLVESRVLPTDHVWTDGMPDWKLACEVPGLLPAAPPGPPMMPPPPQAYWPMPPGAWSPAYPGPWTPPAPAGDQSSAWTPPSERVCARAIRAHRARMVVALGIAGLLTFMFLVFGILAWNVGSGDLREMAEGRMDRSGQVATRTGMVLGIIAVVMGVLTTLASIVAGLGWRGDGFNRFVH